jgi:hypothetical protein
MSDPWGFAVRKNEYVITYEGKEVGWDGPAPWSDEKPTEKDLRNAGLKTLSLCREKHAKTPFDPAKHGNIWKWFS